MIRLFQFQIILIVFLPIEADCIILNRFEKSVFSTYDSNKDLREEIGLNCSQGYAWVNVNKWSVERNHGVIDHGKDVKETTLKSFAIDWGQDVKETTLKNICWIFHHEIRIVGDTFVTRTQIKGDQVGHWLSMDTWFHSELDQLQYCERLTFINVAIMRILECINECILAVSTSTFLYLLEHFCIFEYFSCVLCKDDKLSSIQCFCVYT